MGFGSVGRDFKLIWASLRDPLWNGSSKLPALPGGEPGLPNIPFSSQI